MDKLNLIFMFSFEVPAKDTDDGFKNAMPIVKKCEGFADATGILVACDHTGVVDDKLWVRVRFNIAGNQNPVLLKVATLFAFAASLELSLINQFFLPEKEF